MAGHSKWANIKFRKGAQDAKRGKIFTKLIRAITVAARDGGPDLSSNPQLRLAIDKALQSNMKKDSIKRAVESGVGGQSGDLQFARYDGYAHSGVAVMVDCFTNNKNRTVAEVRHAFSKYGGNLGTDGSVSYLFSQIGFIKLSKGPSEDEVFDIAASAGADDILSHDDGSIEVSTSIDTYVAVKNSIESAGFTIEASDTIWEAATKIELDLETAQKVMKIVSVLEDLDDVQNVYTNADIADDILEQLT
ncbi:MAG: YebC/PmpR family DNA-binding transcriptional regulator [Legionellales bacterium]|jgi:YebC/PmpR family DNA-binding regulatory protein|nr:YebC/PmpR family DNA-binding transcriptional regulator [Legionellales bacterium]